MIRLLTLLVSGFLFGLGLSISQLLNPAKVLGFLNIFGAWDPSLIFTMLAAVLISSLGFVYSKKQVKPLLASTFNFPTKTKIDLKLILGAVLFGIGWGLIGLCPGPAIAVFAYFGQDIALFFASMITGILVLKALRL